MTQEANINLFLKRVQALGIEVYVFGTGTFTSSGFTLNLRAISLNALNILSSLTRAFFVQVFEIAEYDGALRYADGPIAFKLGPTNNRTFLCKDIDGNYGIFCCDILPSLSDEQEENLLADFEDLFWKLYGYK